MRTHVSFQHPVEFVTVSEDEGILATSGAQWFVSLLQRIPGLQVDGELCQEDWGVVLFARRDQKKFWIGLSQWPDGEHAWLAHFHHGSFAWLQQISASGKGALQRVISDFHRVLVSEPAIADIIWYEESDRRKNGQNGFETPI